MECLNLNACENRLKIIKEASMMDLDDIYDLTHYMYSMEYSKSVMKKVLNNLFSHSFPNCLLIIAHILVCEGDYKLSLEYISLGLKTMKSSTLYFLKALCEYRLGDYSNCLNTLSKLDAKEYNEEIYELTSFCNSNIKGKAI